MRVLLDEQLPLRLARELTGHDVRTVRQQGWSGLTNGELLKRAAADGFEVLLTADRSLQFQQNLVNSQVAVVVLVAPRNSLKHLLPLVPRALVAISAIRPGEVVRITT
jgi:predicted nuclease of predicted toxin-antitoxin system